MRAPGQVSEFVRGNVAQYGMENAEMRNPGNGGKWFDKLC
jgi:hypothetical protein